MRVFWIVLTFAAVALVALLLARSRDCRPVNYRERRYGCGDCCADCCCAECCGECCGDLAYGAFDCCTISSLRLFVIGVVALWGGGLALAAWLVLSLVRA